MARLHRDAEIAGAGCVNAGSVPRITLVLLPGMDGTGDLFDVFVAALGGQFNIEIVRYRLREALGYDALEAVARNAIPAHGPWILLGESFSGPIAVSLAATSSSELKGVVLCATFVSNPQPLWSGLRGLVPALPLRFAPAWLVSYLMLGRASTKSLRAALGAALARVSAVAWQARLNAVLAVDVSSKLAAQRVPILYLRAQRDRLVPAAASELIARLAPHAVFALVDAPHSLLQTNPVEAARMVSEFVRKCER